MLPITAGIEKTKFNILLYAFLMLPVVIAPFFTGFGSVIYLTLSLFMTIYYISLCYQLFKTKAVSKSNLIARKIFVYSIFYLRRCCVLVVCFLLLFLCVCFRVFLWGDAPTCESKSACKFRKTHQNRGPTASGVGISESTQNFVQIP